VSKAIPGTDLATTEIHFRNQMEVNTDPQNRFYNGTHAKSEMVWTKWEVLCYTTPENVDAKMEVMKQLNDFAVSQRGEGARSEYKVVGPRTVSAPPETT